MGQGVHSLNRVTTQSFLQGRRHGRTASGRMDSGHLRIQTRRKQNKNLKLCREILFPTFSQGCEHTAIPKTPLLARARLIFSSPSHSCNPDEFSTFQEVKKKIVIFFCFKWGARLDDYRLNVAVALCVTSKAQSSWE